MKRIHRFSAGLLALAAWLAIAPHPGFALTRETPLTVAQRLETVTAGGLYDPSKADKIGDDTVLQRDARLR